MRPKRHHTEIYDGTYFRDSGPDWIETKTASIKNGREREKERERMEMKKKKTMMMKHGPFSLMPLSLSKKKIFSGKPVRTSPFILTKEETKQINVQRNERTHASSRFLALLSARRDISLCTLYVLI